MNPDNPMLVHAAAGVPALSRDPSMQQCIHISLRIFILLSAPEHCTGPAGQAAPQADTWRLLSHTQGHAEQAAMPCPRLEQHSRPAEQAVQLTLSLAAAEPGWPGKPCQ